MTNPILTSPKLTALTADRDRLVALDSQSRATVWQLTKTLHPTALDGTVSNVTYSKPLPYAWIGFRDEPQSVATIDTGEQHEASRKDEELKLTLAGKPISTSINAREQLENERRQWRAYETAIDFRNREIEAEKTLLAKAYTKRSKPKLDSIMVRLCKSALEMRAAFVEADDLRRHLIDSGVGLHGLCADLPDFLEAPRYKYSDMAEWLRECQREGYIINLPAELKL